MTLIGSEAMLLDVRVSIGEARQWIKDTFAQRAKEIEARYERMKAGSVATRRLRHAQAIQAHYEKLKMPAPVVDTIKPRTHLYKMNAAYMKAHNKLMDKRKAALDALTNLQIFLASIQTPPPDPLPENQGGGIRTPDPMPENQRERGGMPRKIREGVAIGEATQIANKMREHLLPYCERIAVAGSVRRGKATVKDIELVVIPRGGELWKFLDQKLLEGRIQKAEYGHKNGKPLYRWGEKYRGFVWAEMKIEIFAADANNWGYIYLLRTGPGEANHAIMMATQQRNAPFRFKDGIVQRLDGEAIPVPEEKDVFRLLGLGFVQPSERTAARYWQAFNRRGHTWGMPIDGMK